MRHMALVILGILASPALAEEPMSREDEKLMTGAFIRCAGLYQAMAGIVEADGKPSAAEHMRGLGRGAESAALWTFAANYNNENPNEPKPLGAWSDYVKPQIETEKIRFLGLLEIGDTEPMTAAMKECAAINDVQADIVQLIRDGNRPQRSQD